MLGGWLDGACTSSQARIVVEHIRCTKRLMCWLLYIYVYKRFSKVFYLKWTCCFCLIFRVEVLFLCHVLHLRFFAVDVLVVVLIYIFSYVSSIFICFCYNYFWMPLMHIYTICTYILLLYTHICGCCLTAFRICLLICLACFFVAYHSIEVFATRTHAHTHTHFFLLFFLPALPCMFSTFLIEIWADCIWYWC